MPQVDRRFDASGVKSDRAYREYRFATGVAIGETSRVGMPGIELQPEMAATKVDIDKNFAPRFGALRAKTRANYRKRIGLVKDKAFQAGVPLRAELMNLVYDSSDELSHEAEAESLGFNTRRIHPDIYMDELLVGMRVIHQVLPAILKKLGIEEEFKLNPSELSLGDFRQSDED